MTSWVRGAARQLLMDGCRILGSNPQQNSDRMLDLRPVKPDDLELICGHRQEMFRDAGYADAECAAMARPFRRWLAPRLADGSYFGFIAALEHQSIAGIGLMIIDWPPHPSHPLEDRRGYLLNLFVQPEHRRRGVARALLNASEREFARFGVAYVILHATSMGRPLYERSGWAQTTEMAKTLPSASKA
jgi:GNAT superfamily N-acetyltransferase